MVRRGFAGPNGEAGCCRWGLDPDKGAYFRLCGPEANKSQKVDYHQRGMASDETHVDVHGAGQKESDEISCRNEKRDGDRGPKTRDGEGLEQTFSGPQADKYQQPGAGTDCEAGHDAKRTAAVDRALSRVSGGRKGDGKKAKGSGSGESRDGSASGKGK